MTTLIRRLAVTVAAFVVLAQSLPASAQDRICTSDEAQRADLQAGTHRSWEALYKSYKRFGHCDDGSIAEGYSESVARILVDHWNTLPQLATLGNKDAKFLRFALSHLDATLDTGDIEKIKAKAATRCPPGLHAVCIQLEKRAKSALKEQSPPH
jgi:hypothetical protein